MAKTFKIKTPKRTRYTTVTRLTILFFSLLFNDIISPELLFNDIISSELLFNDIISPELLFPKRNIKILETALIHIFRFYREWHTVELIKELSAL